MSLSPWEAIAGAILGCAVGDALGLPYEGLSPRRGVRLLGPPERHRFLLTRGMVSDDTEHTCLVAESLCAAPSDPEAFARELGRRLRWWLIGLPAGIGLATLRATVKLWLGASPARSGVFSAGNGPAMRSAILGAAIDDLDQLGHFVRANTLITHTDPKALDGAWAVALAAWCARRHQPENFFAVHRDTVPTASVEFQELLGLVETSVREGQSTEDFAEWLCGRRGVAGYVYRTVPVVLQCWLQNPSDVRASVSAVIRCGGDSDTTAAIVGAIVGSGVGAAGIPEDWLSGLWEWPHNVRWMQELARCAAVAVSSSQPTPPPRASSVLRLLRNVAFLAIVLAHVGRRALPPY